MLVVIGWLWCALALGGERVEIEVAKADGAQVVPAGERGAVVYLQRKGERKTYEVHGYDTALESTWDAEVDLDKAGWVRGTDVDADHAWLLVQRGLKNLQLVRTRLDDGRSDSFGVGERAWSSDHFVADGEGGVWIGAQVKKKGLLLHVDGAGQTTSVEVGKKKLVQGLTRGLDGTVQASVRGWKMKPGTPLEVLDLEAGAIVGRRLVQPDPEAALLSGRSLALEGDDLVVGTWQPPGLLNGAAGLYVAGFSEAGQTLFRRYRFDEMAHFLDHLPDRRQERVSNRIENKKEKGKTPVIRWNLLLHDPIQTTEGLVLVAEAYYPVYITQSRTVTVSDGRGGTTTRTEYYQVFIGWRFSHALIAAFDPEGGLLWDHSIPLQSKLTSVLQPHVKLHENQGRTTLIYARRGLLRTAVLEGDQLTVEEETITSADTGADEEDKNLAGDAAWWFGDTFLVYGVDRQKLEEGGKTRVFFLSRLAPAAPEPKEGG